jgi:hypothetical protein
MAVMPMSLHHLPPDMALLQFAQCGLKLRNRIVWYFDHGLHASKRFSGRYETGLDLLMICFRFVLSVSSRRIVGLGKSEGPREIKDKEIQ